MSKCGMRNAECGRPAQERDRRARFTPGRMRAPDSSQRFGASSSLGFIWRKPLSRCAACCCGFLLAVAPALAQTTVPQPSPMPDGPRSYAAAREAVHQGNQALRAGKPADALDAYARAQSIEPDAPEIAFSQGLAHYQLGDYGAARAAFEKAAVAPDRQLADDAMYSLGTAYHAEALAQVAEPQVAMERLENAVQRYQSVLADAPDHAAAHDALRKAAVLRRQIREQMQQQQQPQPQNPSTDQQEEQSDQREQQSDSQQQDQQQAPQEQEPSDSQEQGQEQQESPSEPSEQPSQDKPTDQPSAADQQEESSQRADAQDDASESEEASQTSAKEDERASREQAERRLREMMQALRDRQKQRREPPRRVPLAPVDKDW